MFKTKKGHIVMDNKQRHELINNIFETMLVIVSKNTGKDIRTMQNVFKIFQLAIKLKSLDEFNGIIFMTEAEREDIINTLLEIISLKK